MNSKLPSSKILGVNITTAPREEILRFIITGLKKRSKKFYIVTPNPEMLVYATASKPYQNILNGAQVALPDGIGIVVAGNILKKGIKRRITGVDMMYDLVARCAEEGLSIGLLGGHEGVAEKTAECLVKKHPHLRVSFVSEEWSEEGIKNSELGMKEGESKINDRSNKIRNSKFINQNSKKKYIDILFVAFGVPKQEEWIAKNLEKIPVTCAMGVGGSFDFISGKVKRAPKIVRSIGMEWMFRLLIQPWRIKRQMALPRFVYLVIKEKLT